ncbi:DNA repair protein complementing XP-C cells isoform X1 [Tripterygium wilfordii]|uniref:DNA repair protein complementing XP-C cells isoform X1 n=1 Tax=Tripterygium wilfordii TaxID=458696 RepID=A0A7J7DUG3_TRIWF|nr:DNA repair protein RAD4-like [Tripterygium wilfordii]KAF5750000.1 DNA repair protein complementing XP-C cells isoform X1 [Tripterygium wilfordii]
MNESDNDKPSSVRKALDKPAERHNSHNKPGLKKQCHVVQPSVSSGVPENGTERDDTDAIHRNGTGIGNTPRNAGMGSAHEIRLEGGDDDDMQDSDWENGSISSLNQRGDCFDDHIKEVTIEFNEAPDSSGQKPVRRASAEDKELAELVHKVHLLCLLARGRIIDNACDDPLIQASLISLLPAKLLKLSEVSKLTVHALSPLMSWFHDNFHVTSSVGRKRSFHSALCLATETRGGTLEEIAALFVALLRGLKFTTRFVSILDVASSKPSIGRYENSSQDACRVRRGIFNSSTVMVDKTRQVPISPARSVNIENDSMCESSSRTSCKSKDGSRGNNTRSKDSSVFIELNNRLVDSSAPEAQSDDSKAFLKEKSQGSKRKGDLEFEMQLEMALAATAAGTTDNSTSSDVKNINCSLSSESSALKRLRRNKNKESPSSSTGISIAVGAGKVGSPLHWAEVFCTGEMSTGKWVHVDAVNAIIDGEQRIEAAAAACKTSLRYVVAFAGRGAKDVTRRYCMQWYKIASQRINSTWWDAVLAPLREVESRETGGVIHVEKNHVDTSDAHRNYLEDMELEIRALTEPLPTNMQAYRNHQLYAVEKWLTKHQILHPKGPILGFCSSHPVYPRDCVQTLRTKQRWLREGLRVKAEEVPAKVLKHSAKLKKVQLSEDDGYGEVDSKGIVELYGKWQLEPLILPHAVNGIVPKNEYGDVEVWSEKCLPPGTVHVRLPRAFSVAKKLGVDYAPAMVGFEFRNGRCIPVFDGIVVCAEFKDAILEAFAGEEERREAEEKKRNEAKAISRWYQLLSSVVTRQRLNNRYGENSSSQMPSNIQKVNMESNSPVGGQHDAHSLDCQNEGRNKRKSSNPSVAVVEDHEHVFWMEEQSSGESNSVSIKRCSCGFSVQVEEL